MDTIMLNLDYVEDKPVEALPGFALFSFIRPYLRT
jgi:hypothetical protein